MWRFAARICPSDVRLTLEQAIPGGMSLEDYSLMREVIAAIREGLLDADQMQPGQVFQHMLGDLRDCSKNVQNNPARMAARPGCRQQARDRPAIGALLREAHEQLSRWLKHHCKANRTSAHGGEEALSTPTLASRPWPCA